MSGQLLDPGGCPVGLQAEVCTKVFRVMGIRMAFTLSTGSKSSLHLYFLCTFAIIKFFF